MEMDLFSKAMKEYNQTNPASATQPSESKEKICDIKNFYDAMTTYIQNKKPKEICLHARTMRSKGWETCLDCRSRLSRIFCDNPYSNVGGYNFTKPKEDRFPKIREIMTEMIWAIIREKSLWDGVPPEAGLPRELSDYTRELCMTCLDHLDKNVKCHIRSLCAAVLWKKVKYLYPKSITLTKFSKRVGVSVPTINKILAKL